MRDFPEKEFYLKIAKNFAEKYYCKQQKNTQQRKKRAPFTEEMKIRMRLMRAGRPPPMLGKKHSAETKEKMRLKKLGNTNWKGNVYTEEYRRKMSEGMKKYLRETPCSIERLRTQSIKNLKKDTKPELKLQLALKEKQILFEKHKIIMNRTEADIFIMPNICVFVDGCWWHGCEACIDKKRFPSKILKRKESDIRVNTTLLSGGYKVLRLWEHEINKNIENCVSRCILAK